MLPSTIPCTACAENKQPTDSLSARENSLAYYA
jgi:hypothetical protein